MLTDGQSDVAGSICTRRICVSVRRLGWKIWILSFQAKTTQTLKLVRRLRCLGKEVGTFLLSNCRETSVETGSLNLEFLKACSTSLISSNNSNAWKCVIPVVCVNTGKGT